jgi:UV DNA damage endonuclease
MFIIIIASPAAVVKVDYSSQQTGKCTGTHAATIHPEHFRAFLKEVHSLDLDIMLEIKAKEKSTLKAVILTKNYYG